MATMSSTTTETTLPESPNKGVQALLQDSRIDAAHCVGPDAGLVSTPASDSAVQPNADAVMAESAENSPVQAGTEIPNGDLDGERLEKQAEQLAHFLRDRQRELDHREAQLNAEIAQLETDLRRQRMCLSEREADLDQRRRQLDMRENEILERLERLAAADTALKRKAEAETELAATAGARPLEEAQLARQPAEQNDKRQLELEEAEHRLAQRKAKSANFRNN